MSSRSEIVRASFNRVEEPECATWAYNLLFEPHANLDSYPFGCDVSARGFLPVSSNADSSFALSLGPPMCSVTSGSLHSSANAATSEGR